MPSAERGQIRRVHSPLMSKPTFGRVWCAKFALFVDLYVRNKPTTPLQMIIISIAAYEYLSTFHTQACELSLDLLSFPPEKFSPQERQSGDLRVARVNPFHSAMTLLFMVDPFLCRLDSMKMGEVVGGMVWEDLPVRSRGDVEGVFKKVERAKRERWWAVPEDRRQEALRKARARDRRI